MMTSKILPPRTGPLRLAGSLRFLSYARTAYADPARIAVQHGDALDGDVVIIEDAARLSRDVHTLHGAVRRCVRNGVTVWDRASAGTLRLPTA